MAKKSKIARNEQRKVIVARYNEKRIALKKTLIDENATPEEREAARVHCRSCPATLPPFACVIATRSTAAPAVPSRSSVSPACASARWHTVASCPVSPSPAGKSGILVPKRFSVVTDGHSL